MIEPADPVDEPFDRVEEAIAGDSAVGTGAVAPLDVQHTDREEHDRCGDEDEVTHGPRCTPGTEERSRSSRILHGEIAHLHATFTPASLPGLL